MTAPNGGRGPHEDEVGVPDVVIVGAGGAGCSLLLHLDRLVRARPGLPAPSVVVVDPVHRRGEDRTWCFWHAGPAPAVLPVTRTWGTVRTVSAGGVPRDLPLAPLRYTMVRSSDVYRAADAAARRLGVRRVSAAVLDVRDGRDGAIVVTEAGEVRGRWVLDSRPARAERARTDWSQQFRGRLLRTSRPVFDPDLPVLMDFSVPQPAGGVAFGYLLPLAADRALVEFTHFTGRPWTRERYDAAMVDYQAQVLGRLGTAGPGSAAVDVTVEYEERGGIPMSDGSYRRRASPHVFRLGTAGGATRPSTGYTFAAIQRQCAVVAAALLDGREPLPPPAYPARHLWMDGVLLRGLDSGRLDGPALFSRLFERNPPARLLQFLDGVTDPLTDLRVMATAPPLAMLAVVAGDAARSARRAVGAIGADRAKPGG